MPSEKVLESKKAIVADLVERLKTAQAGVIADYRGLTVAQDTELRAKLREAGVEYFVVKNTLLKRAAEKAGIVGLDEHLEGTTAIALHEEDIIAGPKILFKQVEKSKGAFAVKVGFIGKDAITASEVEEYAKLPSKETLVSKLLFMLQSPMQRLAIAASEIAKKQENGEVA